ncbi:UDP-galactopyranose mutase [Modestobacter sp. DSM 44400]|uniref:NAD(P)/FAD-dependent oxidoreductase n=1 Tax=Modestobacter sp. DSM 44400 TaxID=1550230 RepID=UPI000899938C|nr:NAD(P)/FAD-dependent oxidoreductase [Modestobacter sp. DSM 44400]SDX66433.1 UDP-galactopyranose mutase [Modestobacter sp. DSM 44400]
MPEFPSDHSDVVVIGAGPAGLTAAHELTRRGLPVTVLEADDVVGGISRTVEREGWRFDIGGHRFFTKVPAVEAWWHAVLTDDEFLSRPRMSRILYAGTLFDYPLKPMNALRSLGVVEAVRCVASYVQAQVRPPADQSHFEGWVSARFGRRLYEMFFKTYTEKVWGMPATEIQADWAAQRIKDLSLGTAILHALRPGRHTTTVTTLIEEFQYPKTGPGLMWERATEQVRAAGGVVRMRTAVTALHREDGRVTAVTTQTTDDTGQPTAGHRLPAAEVISSMPLPELVLAMDPPAPEHVQVAARALSHRDFLTVALVVPESAGFPDNWIYVHSPEARVGRVQNFGSWSPYLVKDGRTCLGLEYFVDEGDDLWESPDDDLIVLATKELDLLGLVQAGSVERGYVVRMPKAYPVYDKGYDRQVDLIRAWLAEAAVNVHPVGRNGMHRYNNADHSMVTAMLTVENIVDDAQHDVWSVNVEEDYHEQAAVPDVGPSGSDRPAATVAAVGTGRSAPVRPRQPVQAA